MTLECQTIHFIFHSSSAKYKNYGIIVYALLQTWSNHVLQYTALFEMQRKKQKKINRNIDRSERKKKKESKKEKKERKRKSVLYFKEKRSTN